MSEYLAKFKDIQKDYASLTDHINLALHLSVKQETPYFHKNLSIEQGIFIGAD